MIKAGEGIIASNQSANRDEEIFPDPDVFDMHRQPGPFDALGFGFGPHRCIAEPLARAELEAVFGRSMVSWTDTLDGPGSRLTWLIDRNPLPKAPEFALGDPAGRCRGFAFAERRWNYKPTGCLVIWMAHLALLLVPAYLIENCVISTSRRFPSVIIRRLVLHCAHVPSTVRT